MAVYFASHVAGVSAPAVAAVPGKRIRLKRLIVSTDTNTGFTLAQDIGGASAADISPKFQIRASGGGIDYVFIDEKPQTGPGLSLGYTIDAVSASTGVWIEYEAVS